MEGFSFRPASLDDIHVIHQIITQQNILDYGDPLRSVEDVQRTWGSPIFDLQSVDSKNLMNAPRLYESVGMGTTQKYHVYKKAI